MNLNPPNLLRLGSLAAVICAVLFCTSGCGTDLEYVQKLATARTDWTGREIAGIWVGRSALVGRTILLLRPDGTGIKRWSDFTGPQELELTWHYAGAGVWKGEVTAYGTHISLHYNGEELLWDDFDHEPAHRRDVFVRAENESAVDEYLKKRE